MKSNIKEYALLLLFLGTVSASCKKDKQAAITQNANTSNLVPDGFVAKGITETKLNELSQLSENTVLFSSLLSTIDGNDIRLIDSATRLNIPVLVEGNKAKLSLLRGVTGVESPTDGTLLIYNDKSYGFTTDIIPDKMAPVIVSKESTKEEINLAIPDQTKDSINSIARSMGYSQSQIEQRWKNYQDSLGYYRSSIQKNFSALSASNVNETGNYTSTPVDIKKIISNDLVNRRRLKLDERIAAVAKYPLDQLFKTYKHVEYFQLGSFAGGCIKTEFIHHIFLKKKDDKLLVDLFIEPYPGISGSPDFGTDPIPWPWGLMEESHYYGGLLTSFGFNISYPKKFAVNASSPTSREISDLSFWYSGRKKYESITRVCAFNNYDWPDCKYFPFIINDYDFSYKEKNNDNIKGHSKNWNWDMGYVEHNLDEQVYLKPGVNNAGGLVRKMAWLHFHPDLRSRLFVEFRGFPVPMSTTSRPSANLELSLPSPGQVYDAQFQTQVELKWQFVRAHATYFLFGVAGALTKQVSTYVGVSGVNWTIYPDAVK